MKKLPAAIVLGKGLLLLPIAAFFYFIEHEAAVVLAIVSAFLIVCGALLFAFLPEKKDGNYF